MSDPNGYNDSNQAMTPIPDALQDSVVEAPFDNRFALIGLNPNSPSPSKNHHQPCFNCGCTGCVSNSLKRRSPSSSSSFQDPLTAFSPDSERTEPHPKKLFLDHEDLTRQGFSKLSLPVPSAPAQPQHSQPQPQAQVQVHPVLRRSVSDPYQYHPSITSTFVDPFAAGLGFQVPNPNPPQSPEEAKKRILQLTPPSNSGLPPLPPPLIRSVSDPTPSPAKTYSRSSSSGNVSVDLTKEKTPNSNSNFQRLRRMKDCAIEMSKCYEQITREQEVKERGTEDKNAATKDNCATEFEESVFVERVGEGLTIHFECPCGKGYQILLSGQDCYYKLM